MAKTFVCVHCGEENVVDMSTGPRDGTVSAAVDAFVHRFPTASKDDALRAFLFTGSHKGWKVPAPPPGKAYVGATIATQYQHAVGRLRKAAAGKAGKAGKGAKGPTLRKAAQGEVGQGEVATGEVGGTGEVAGS